MKKLICYLTISFYTLLQANAFNKNVPKKVNAFEVGISKNLETFAIVERYANKYSRYLKNRDSLLLIQPTIRPMVYYAYETFKNRNNTSVAKQMAKLIDTIISSKVGGQDQIFYALVHAETFPKKGFIAPYVFHNDNLSNATNEYINNEILLLIEALRKYYIKNNVARFLAEYNDFYEGCMQEIFTGIPTNISLTMEDYYRTATSTNEYAVFIVPTRAFSKGEWQANACTLKYKNGIVKKIQFLSSSYVEVPLSENGNYTKFGFGDNEWLQDMLVHEYGHTFCDFDSITNVNLKKSAFLFSGKWEEGMKPIGYYTWDVCVNEHVVRTSEIRIAEKTGDTTKAIRLRKSYINDKKFIFIPLLENKFLEYENNESKYPSFKSFLPDLIGMFDNVTIEERDKLLKEIKK
jgi:hypothetical protein